MAEHNSNYNEAQDALNNAYNVHERETPRFWFWAVKAIVCALLHIADTIADSRRS
jgi:hypothetical protein